MALADDDAFYAALIAERDAELDKIKIRIAELEVEKRHIAFNWNSHREFVRKYSKST